MSRRSVADYRRKNNRCEAVKVELTGKRRSWRCQLVAGHKGRHESSSGHRNWDDPAACCADAEQFRLDV
jgi:hypothetical protein